MYRTVKLAACLAAVLALAMTGAAMAAKGGAGTETTTVHLPETVLIYEEKATNPCTGEKGLLVAISANAKEHSTTHADGDAWGTFNAEGTVTFTPYSPEGATYSGHFHIWGGESLNNKNEVNHETGTFVLRAANGSQVTVHMVGHASTNGKGEPVVEFHTEDAHCGV
jgi:hypothetical protein